MKKDRLVKAPLYASSGFEEYWLFDVTAGAVEVYREPREGVYSVVTLHGPGEVLAMRAFPDVLVPVDAVFG